MEIIPFLRLNAQRVVILWLVGCIAAAGGAMYARSQPVRHTGESTVFLDRVYPGNRYDREPFVANFESAVKFLTSTHGRVGEQLDMSAVDVGNALEIDVPDNSDIAYVRFTTSDAQQAQRGAQLLATETLHTLTTDSAAAAQAALDRAQAQQAEALAAVQAITTPFAVVDLEREYESVDNQVKDLEKQVAGSDPNNVATVNLNALLEFRRQQRGAIANALPSFQDAKARLDKLSEVTNATQTTVDTANARVAVAQNGEAVVSEGTSPESKMQKMLRFGGAAAIAAVALAILVFLIIEAVNRPRARRVQASAGPVNGHSPTMASVPAAPTFPTGVGAGRPGPGPV